MLRRLLLIYAIVELAAFFLLISTIGWGWALMALLVSFVLGWGLLAPMAGSHLIGQIGRLRSAPADPTRAVSDGALVTLATALVLVPGVVTTALGLLLLIPPIRSAARPGLTALGMRGLRRRMPLLTDATLFGAGSRRGYVGDGRDYIDGEVIDVLDVEPPSLAGDPIHHEFPGRPASSAS
jgi:UPF0716 protein FxsA